MLVDERNKWREQFEKGHSCDVYWLEEYRKNRERNDWRCVRELERLCEYILYLESGLDEQ